MSTRLQDIYIITLMSGSSDKDIKNIIAFVGDTHISIEEFQSKQSHYIQEIELYLQEPLEYESVDLSKLVLIQDYIFREDTIETIKLKIIQALHNHKVLGDLVIGVEDMYLYTETILKLNKMYLYKLITKNNKIPLHFTLLEQFLKNMVGYTNSLQKKDIYTMDDFMNLKELDVSNFIYTPIGYEHSQYFFTTNPYLVTEYDFNLQSQTISYYPSKLLLEYGEIKGNRLYLCLSNDIMALHEKTKVSSTLTSKVYFPLLQGKSLDDSFTRFDLAQSSYLDKKHQYDSLNAFQDVYHMIQSDTTFNNKGLYELSLTYYSQIPFQIPLTLLFKLIQSNEMCSLIRLKPDKRSEHLYRLYTGNQVATNGRKIPMLSLKEIKKIIKILPSQPSVTCVCTTKEYQLQFIFLPNGEIMIQYTGKVNEFKEYILKTKIEIEEIIREILTPIITSINLVIQQNGMSYQPLYVLENPYVECHMIQYVYQYTISQNIDLSLFISCLSHIFIIEESDINKGIQMRFKLVPNFNTHTAVDALILTMAMQRKSQKQIKMMLIQSFGMTSQQAETKLVECLQNAQTELTAFGNKKIKIKDNPGFPISMKRNQNSNNISIIVDDINNIYYISIIDKYITVLLLLSQDLLPDISYKSILCNTSKSSSKKKEVVQEKTKTTQVLGKTQTKQSALHLLYDDDDEEEEEEKEQEEEQELEEAVDNQDIQSVEDLEEFDFDDLDIDDLDLDDLDLEDETDETSKIVQKGGLHSKENWVGTSLKNPGIFNDYMYENEPNIYFRTPINNYSAYSKLCPSSYKRQPVMLSQTEYETLIEKEPNEWLLLTENTTQAEIADHLNVSSKFVLKYASGEI